MEEKPEKAPKQTKKEKDLAKLKAEKREEDLATPRDYEIRSGKLKDGCCHYGLKIIEGINAEDTQSVKSDKICKDDLINAFVAFNKHLACIDDGYEVYEEVPDINQMDGDDVTFNYRVTDFAVTGEDDDLLIVLTGSKSVKSTSGRIKIVTPQIPLQGGSYKWSAELEECLTNIQLEISLYREGKFDEKEEEEKPNTKQISIFDASVPDIRPNEFPPMEEV